jgi:1,4-alpha-glucan branching enzyme
VAGASEHIAHLFGVRRTSQGILFVQPGRSGHSVSVAGDFNGWSPTQHRLSHNAQLDVYQTIIRLPPGAYRYRLVVDGRWQVDQFNPSRESNPYGESSSVLTVEP